MKVSVPMVIETQSGEVVRYMQRESQAFEFEREKIVQREKKIVRRAEEHEEATRESVAGERETCFKCFEALGEAVDGAAREEDAAEERLQPLVVRAVREVQELVQEERESRCEKDIALMAGLEATLGHIQGVIIHNFGTGKE